MVRIRPKYCSLFCAAAGRTDCHASSPQSPPCPAPAKGQSRATLPWGSFPHKACRFAGPRGYAGQRPELGNAPLGLPSPQKVPLCGGPALARNDMLKVVTRLRLQGGLARGVRKNLPRGCKGKGQFSSPGCKKSTGAKQALLRRWQGMRDSNPRKRSQSPVCYRYTNPLF